MSLKRRINAFWRLYNTTAHQGLLKEQFASPIPLHVLGEVKGRLYTPQELERKFAHALFPRTTNRYGCVTLHSYHFYVDQGVPQTQVLLWVSGQELRAVFDNVLLAEYHCHYDCERARSKTSAIGRFTPTRFASSQGSLMPFNPQECCVVYRPQSWSHRDGCLVQPNNCGSSNLSTQRRGRDSVTSDPVNSALVERMSWRGLSSTKGSPSNCPPFRRSISRRIRRRAPQRRDQNRGRVHGRFRGRENVARMYA